MAVLPVGVINMIFLFGPAKHGVHCGMYATVTQKRPHRFTPARGAIICCEPRE